MSDALDIYVDKKVKLIIRDGDRVKTRDGIFYDSDDTFILIQLAKFENDKIIGYNPLPHAFLKLNVIRIDVEEEDGNTK